MTVIATDNGLKLSPAENTTPIIIGLVLFQVGYIIFMIMMFGEDIKAFFTKHAKESDDTK